MDVCFPSRGICILPQIDALGTIVEAYPQASFIHVRQSNLHLQVSEMAAFDNMVDRYKEVRACVRVRIYFSHIHIRPVRKR